MWINSINNRPISKRTASFMHNAEALHDKVFGRRVEQTERECFFVRRACEEALGDSKPLCVAEIEGLILAYARPPDVRCSTIGDVVDETSSPRQSPLRLLDLSVHFCPIEGI